MTARLAAHVEAAALMRRARADGGFATVLHKGDAERGSIILVMIERGRFFACLERLMSETGDYRWTVSGPQENAELAEIREFLQRRQRFDSDSWIIELDIAEAKRFTAEMIESS